MGDAVTSSAIPEIEELWCEKSPEALKCRACGGGFETEALIRTFRLRKPGPDTAAQIPSRVIKLPTEDIVIVDRHLRCLSGLRYLAISHVWDLTVSEVHEHGKASPHKEEARDHILKLIGRINHGLVESLEGDIEVWHDYISVPQWEYGLKSAILMAIPHIFFSAHFTLVHMDDVGEQMVDDLRSKGDPERLISGITGICNAKWFKRVWTSMEYIRSRTVRVMNRDGHIVEGVEDVFLNEMLRLWDGEVDRAGSVHTVEAMADLGENLVPWSLGPLQTARELKKVDFGIAFALLSKRGCKSSRDFFHALLGIVNADLTGPLEDDPEKAMLQIATACLKAGDYSPLLMTPVLEHGDRRLNPVIVRKHGYNDILTFGLGHRTGSPLYHADFVFRSGVAALKLERIGPVNFVWKAPKLDADTTFVLIIQAVLHFTGPVVDDFVRTVCTRLYNQSDEETSKLLSDPKRRNALQKLLERWYDSAADQPWKPERQDEGETITDIMNLSAPLENMYAHGGTIHGCHAGVLVGASCKRCNRTFIFRAALFQRDTDIFNSVAYRIPGLGYHCTRPDGVGLLVKDGDIVGRLNWASPACDCHDTEMVGVKLGNLPLPSPRDC